MTIDPKNVQIILLVAPKIVKYENEKQNLLEKFHCDPIFGGHAGQKKLLEKLRGNYYWKNMTRDIANFVQKCQKCQMCKLKPKSKEPMTITPTPQEPFEILVVDSVGPLPKSLNDNCYIVTIMCELTKYLITVPIPNKQANTVVRAIFENVILFHGPMKILKPDRGSEFKNEIFEHLCKFLHVEQKFSTAYHHETVGTVERNYRNLNEYFRIFMNENLDHWEEYLLYFTFCYYTTNQSSFNDKYSPYELVYGKKPLFPKDFNTANVDPIYNIDNFAKIAKYRLQRANKIAGQILEKMKLRNKNLFDKKAKPSDLRVNDKVLTVVEPYNKTSQTAP